ncbi:MAG: hypothetical protein M4579_006495 [Chaenotheca gracillima]|nr:MAG: hypothetical protein M4579_006495 [Chaenotheca gracillima]
MALIGSELASPSGLTLPEFFPTLKFIFPTAAKRRSTVLKRTPINQWFDNFSLVDPSRREELQIEGLTETAAYVRALIDEETRTIPSERVFLGGLSQGSAAAVYTLLTLDQPLGGFIGMSGWFPFARHVADILDDGAGGGTTDGVDDLFETDGKDPQSPEWQAINFLRENIGIDAVAAVDDVAPPPRPPVLGTPVILGHGEVDEKVNCRLGRQTGDTLTALGMDVDWTIYPNFGHWYKEPEQIDHIAAFLQQKMGRESAPDGAKE